MKITKLSNVSFQSELPPLQKKTPEPQKNWQVYGRDYWDDFSLKCEEEGLSKGFFKSLDKLRYNGDDGILALDEYVSDKGLHSYVFGLYDSNDDLELDRQNADKSENIHISNTRNGKKHIVLRDNDMEANLATTNSDNEKIALPTGISVTAALLLILKKIVKPNSKEAQHIGLDPVPDIIKGIKNLTIK